MHSIFILLFIVLDYWLKKILRIKFAAKKMSLWHFFLFLFFNLHPRIYFFIGFREREREGDGERGGEALMWETSIWNKHQLIVPAHAPTWNQTCNQVYALTKNRAWKSLGMWDDALMAYLFLNFIFNIFQLYFLQIMF